MRVLVVGGYGVFGGRLVRLLKHEARLTLIVAGRSHAKAAAFAQTVSGAAATLVAVEFDRAADLDRQLSALQPDLVVDAAGPFQTYGSDDGNDGYALVAAALRHSIPYIDIADGTDFVLGIARFDAEARAKGLFALSGVSSFPALTGAAMRRLAEGLAHVDTITTGIAPSPRAGVGLNVIRAIASYAGQPVQLTRAGRLVLAFGLTESRRLTIGPPGLLPLHSIHFSLVDVPDLQLLPAAWPGLRSIWTGAGTVPESLHRLLNGLAWAVRWRLLPALTPLAPLFHRVLNRLNWGEHRGGLVVAISGTAADGQPVDRSWHLIAEGDDGPMIPAMGVAALIAKMLAGEQPAAGARTGLDVLQLADFEPLFARHAIQTGLRGMTPAPADAPLYQRVLDSAWDRLPAPVRAMHDWRGTRQVAGRARVEVGGGMLAGLLRWLIGFPAGQSDVPVMVHFTEHAGIETWQRDFAGQRFVSYQSAGTGRFERLIVERFGPFRFGLAVVADADSLRLIVRRWSCLGLVLPLWLAPTSAATETADNDRFNFNVAISHAWVGLIVRYAGWLVPSD